MAQAANHVAADDPVANQSPCRAVGAQHPPFTIGDENQDRQTVQHGVAVGQFAFQCIQASAVAGMDADDGLGDIGGHRAAHRRWAWIFTT